MDNQSAGISFALIGHQDNWEKIYELVNVSRIENGTAPLSLEKIKDVFSYIPPRDLFEINVYSSQSGVIRGVYIETFISPDELDIKHLHTNVRKVKEACNHAAKMKIPVAALGGITSIVLECSSSSSEKIDDTFFTTGNTLTAAFIAKAVEGALSEKMISPSSANVLIIGSTGDIGTACTNYFSGKVARMLLNARKPFPLEKQAARLSESGQDTVFSTNLNDLLPETDVLISVASSLVENCDISLLPGHAIICDAGYPKNIDHHFKWKKWDIFYGGLGLVAKGFETVPSFYKKFYRFAVTDVVHGCLLEAVVLAMEKRFAAYSKGKGNITVSAMEEIYSMANFHGIVTAPRFNNVYCLKGSIQPNYYETRSSGASAAFQTYFHTQLGRPRS